MAKPAPADARKAEFVVYGPEGEILEQDDSRLEQRAGSWTEHPTTLER